MNILNLGLPVLSNSQNFNPGEKKGKLAKFNSAVKCLYWFPTYSVYVHTFEKT